MVGAGYIPPAAGTISGMHLEAAPNAQNCILYAWSNGYGDMGGALFMSSPASLPCNPQLQSDAVPVVFTPLPGYRFRWNSFAIATWLQSSDILNFASYGYVNSTQTVITSPGSTPATGHITFPVNSTFSDAPYQVNWFGTFEKQWSTGLGNIDLTYALTDITQAFTPASIKLGQTSTLTFTITNSNSNGVGAFTALNLTETLPAGLQLASAPISSQCGGAVTGTVGGTVFALTGGNVGSSPASCSVAVQVKAATAGTYVNNISNLNQNTSGSTVGPTTYWTGDFGDATLIVANITLSLQKKWSVNSKEGDAITIVTAGGSNNASVNSTSTNQNTAVTTGTAVNVQSGDTISLPSESFTVGSQSDYKTTVSCNNSDGTVLNNSILPATVVVGALDSSIVCTYTNVATTVRVQAITTGGFGGSFSFTQTNLASAPANIATVAAATATPASPTIVGATSMGTSITLTETAAIGYLLTNASCTDANSVATGNIGSTFATLSGNVLTIPAANVVVGADFTCIFTNQLLSFDHWDGAGPADNGVVNGGAGTWNSTNTNWTNSLGNSNGIWQSGATAFFKFPAASPATVSVSGTQQVGGLTFESTAPLNYSISGGSIQGTGTPTKIVNAGSSVTQINTVLTGGNHEFSNTGPGTYIVSLQGNNTFTGTATVKSGWLLINHANALGTSSAGTTVENGAGLVLEAGVVSSAEPLTIAGNGGAPGSLIGQSNANYTGPVMLSAPATISSSNLIFTVSGTVNNAGYTLTANTSATSSLLLSGVISGAGGIVTTGSSVMTLGAVNSYAGSTTVSNGTLKLGLSGGLPSTSSVTVASAAKLDMNGTTQSVPKMLSTGTVALGSNSNLTLTSGASSISAITGTGTITVNTGATLTLTSALINTGVNFVLNGGTLNLGSLTHSIGTLTVNANSTLDFSSTGNAQLTTTSLTLSASNTLAVTNWTKNLDRFYATGVNTPTPAIDAINLAPLNRIAMGANAASLTAWFSTGSEISVLGSPTLAMVFSPASVTSGLNSTLTITLTNPNATPLNSAAFTNAYPTNLVNAAIPGGTTTCMNSTVTAAASGTSLALSGATIPASGNCTVAVNVTSAAIGSYINTLATGAVTTSGGANAAAASATLTVTFVGTYWDGPNTAANGLVDGGISTWDASTINWTSSTGTPNGAWASGSVAVFQGTTGHVTVSGTQNIGGLTFDVAHNILGDPLNGTATINTVINNASGAVYIDSVISGSKFAFTKGQIALRAANTYTGGTMINGTATVFSDNMLSFGTGAVQIDTGGTAVLRDDYMWASPFVLGGGTLSNFNSGTGGTANGTITQTAASRIVNQSGIFTFNNSITNAGFGITFDIASSSTTNVSGVIAGGGGLEQTGSGVLYLLAANSYSGNSDVKNTATLKLGINNAIPTASITTVASGATLDLNNRTQTLSAGLTSSGTLALGAGGILTLSGSNSIITGAVTGSGKIVVGPSATLTLTSALANSGVEIELAGGTLNLGTFTHNIGKLTVSAANSTLDFGSTGNAQLTATSLTLSASTTLAVTNWTRTGDHFYATAFVGATRNITGATPMNRITLGANAAAATVWQTDNEITLQLDPKLRISKTSNGGVGNFVFQLTGLSAADDSIATVANGIAVQGVGTLTGTSGVAVTITESGVPAGWPANPTSASCADANGASNANGTAAFGTLTGKTLLITATHMLQGADIVCSFINTLNAISGTVFNDGGAPTAGVNSGIPNDGLQNGSEAGLAGVGVGLTDCASVTHATATTDSAGRYALRAPAAAVGQTVCIQPTPVAGQRPTGANVEGTATPDGATTTVGGTAFVYSRATSRQSFIEPASGTRTLNFGLVPESTLAANSSKSAAPGAIALHAHTFVAGTGGSVSFASGTSTSTPAMAGWNEVMYLNSGCATSLQPGATKLSPPSVAQNVLQGQTVCFFMQAFVPASAVNGSSNSVPVIATMTFTNAAPLLTATYTVTDVTTSGTSALSLQKEVRNITTGGAWGTNNQAKSGDTLEYRISYVNPSAAPLSTVVITDGTSLYTTFVNATASTAPPALGNCTLNTPTNPLPAAGVACTPPHTGLGKGTVRWEFSGTLAPGASGSVNYSVLVD